MFENVKERMQGCFYTIFTPFKEDDSIDYEVLKQYLTHLYQGGARKFYAMAYNSRYSQLTDQEIIELNRFCIRTVKALDSTNIIVVGDPIHCSTKQTIDVSQHAKDDGADVVSLIVREKYFCDEQILDHYAEVADAIKMPIMVHEMPFLHGYDGGQKQWPISLIKKLPSIPEIIALKEDAKSLDIITPILELEPRLRVVIAGPKSAFIGYKKLGATAYLNGISMIDAKIGETFWQAYCSDDKDTIQFIIEQLEAPIFKTVLPKYGWHRINKAILQAAGLMHRRDRMPLQHLKEEAYNEVKEAYSVVANNWKNWQETQ